jgi:1,4-dihydroxy-2-naphthoyl-CoA hydrolase
MVTREQLNSVGVGTLPGLLGIEIVEAEGTNVVGQLAVKAELMAPNGYLHAGTVIALADTTCGYGVLLNLPEGAQGFTTIELKSNFVGTVREGTIQSRAMLVHGGRTTQVWDATVTDVASQRVIAMFRCTQLILYPRQ